MTSSCLFLSKKTEKDSYFRGKDIYFWIAEIFNHFSLSKFKPSPGSSILEVVVSGKTFPVITKESAKEVHKIIGSLKPDHQTIFTFEDCPFYLVPQKIVKKYNTGPDELGRLISHEPITILNLKNRIRTVKISENHCELENLIKGFQVKYYLSRGVLFKDFTDFYIEGLPEIGKGTSIYPGAYISQECKIGKNVEIFPHCYLEKSIIGDNTIILPNTVIRDSNLESQVTIGPFTHIRNNSLVKKGAKMGNFVEMKKSLFSEGAKAMHLSYIGDASIGKKVNIGAGTITCNYDGQKKNPTVIEDNVFIGSGTELVAPVTIKKNSYVGAGSTITEDVPPDSLAVARNKQRNILGWALRKRKIQSKK